MMFSAADSSLPLSVLRRKSRQTARESSSFRSHSHAAPWGLGLEEEAISSSFMVQPTMKLSDSFVTPVSALMSIVWRLVQPPRKLVPKSSVQSWELPGLVEPIAYGVTTRRGENESVQAIQQQSHNGEQGTLWFENTSASSAGSTDLTSVRPGGRVGGNREIRCCKTLECG